MINFFRSFPLIEYAYNNTGSTILSVDINRNVKAYLDEINGANAYLLQNLTDGIRPDQLSMKLYDTPVYYWTFFVLNERLLNGLHAWPKASYELSNYIDEKYYRKSITGYSKEGINNEGHLLYSKTFEVGETVTGEDSDATGIISKIDYPMNRLLLTDVVGTFIDENITGETSGAIMPSDSTYYVSIEDEKNAAHHYENSSEASIERLAFNINDNVIEVTNYEYEDKENDGRMQIRVLNPSMINQFATKYKKLINA